MPKIVITDKFMDSFQSQPAEQRHPVTSKSLPATRQNLTRFCQHLSIDPAEIAPVPVPIPATRFKKKELELALQRLDLIPEEIGASLNNILHNLTPSQYPSKNSNMSNFKMSAVFSLRREQSENILALLKKSVSERVMAHGRVVASIQRACTNWNKANARTTKMNENRDKVIATRKLNEDRVPNWQELTDGFYENTFSVQESAWLPRMSAVQAKKGETRDRGNTLRLFAKYEHRWKRGRDFSVRRVDLGSPPLRPKESLANRKVS